MWTSRFPIPVVLACILCMSCLGIQHRGNGNGKKDPKYVILIGIDTLRRDFLSCYGFPHPISPRIDELAHEGALFTDAVAPAPWTLPSFVSMLTGQYPSSHGAGRRTGPQGPGGEPPKAPIRSDVMLLPQILREKGGFESAIFYDNPYLGEKWRFARTFGTVHQSHHGGIESVERALDWSQRHRGHSFFLFLHLMEPHLPYEPPEPYASQARKWFSGNDIDSKAPTLSPPKGARIRALYAGEVTYADHLVGTFLDGLAKIRLLDKALLIVTSDHGEEFYEHQAIERSIYNDPRKIWGIGHGHSQFQELLAVPLILRFPGRVPAGLRVTATVQTLDLAPSILEWVGLDVPAGLSGVSLLPTLHGRRLRRKYAFSEFILYGDERKSYREGEWKVILGPDPEKGELYNLESDPAETINLMNDRPRIYQRLVRRLLKVSLTETERGTAEASRPDSPVVIDEETRKELRSLGYIE